jgi:hypothetical protein
MSIKLLTAALTFLSLTSSTSPALGGSDTVKESPFVLYKKRMQSLCELGSTDDCIAKLNFHDQFLAEKAELGYELHERIKFVLPWEIVLIPFNYWGLLGEYDNYAMSNWKKVVEKINAPQEDFIAYFTTNKNYKNETPKYRVSLEIFRLPLTPELTKLLKDSEITKFEEEIFSALKKLYVGPESKANLLQHEQQQKEVHGTLAEQKLTDTIYSTIYTLDPGDGQTVEKIMTSYTRDSKTILFIIVSGYKDDQDFIKHRMEEVQSQLRWFID